MFSLKERLSEILIRDGLINQEDFDRALEELQRTGGELSKIVVKLKLINEGALSILLSESLGLPPVDIKKLKIDAEATRLVPKEIAQRYLILPVSKVANNLTLAMSDPLNIFILDHLKILSDLEIIPILSRSKEISQMIQAIYVGDTSAKLERIIKDIKDAEEVELIKDAAGAMDRATIENLTQEAPIIKLTDAIIKQSVWAKASDVFIEPMEKTLRIRYRIDGVIREIDQMSKVLHFPIISRIKIISSLDISEHRLPQDGRFKTILDGDKEVDFRVNVLPTAFGEKIVLRVLDKNSAMLDVDKLGFEPAALEHLKECAARPHGLILTCGPTGSGKTTTLYSILKHIDSPGKNIVTVEDPVEYQMQGINQVNVKPGTGLSFTSALRSILRQDPDVILIGEIRDSETLDIAIKAALTGHLVLSSLHTTTASGSIIRIMNMGVEPFLICSSVVAIVAQRLLRKLCVHCKESYEISAEIGQKVGLDRIVGNKAVQLFRARGCKNCFNTGYSGRVGITEILVLTPKVKELILNRAGEGKIKQAGRHDGMSTMREDGLCKALSELTSLEEVLRVTAADEKI